MKILKIYTSILLAVLAFAIACKKEKPLLDISDKDPCSCAEEVSAEFDIFEIAQVYSTIVRTKTDHILENRFATFEAREENAEYKWYIGSEILSERVFSRYFSNDFVEFDVPITLVVRKEPNKVCFPNDDGYDSITKVMHVYDHYTETSMEGVFRMARVNTTDSFDIALNYWTVDGNNRDRISISNYDNESSDCPSDNTQRIALRNYRATRTEHLNAVGCKFLQLDLQRPLDSINQNFYIMKNTFKLTEIGTAPDVVWELHGRKL